jgi:tetratricopeptide (TPR) repeat protein
MTDACYFSDDFPQLAVQSRRLLATCEAVGDRFRAVSAHLGIASAATNLFKYHESIEQLEAAHAIARELAVPRHLFNVLQSRVFHRLRFGAFEEGLSDARDCRVLAEQLGFRSGQFIALFLESALRWSLGDFERAKAVAATSLPLADRVEARRFYSMGLDMLGKCELLLGDLAGALDHLQQALALARETRSGLRFFDTASPLTLTYLRLGRIEDAATLASEMQAGVRERDTRMLDPQLCLWASGQVHRAVGNAAEADAVLKRARQLLAERALAIPIESNRRALLATPFHSELLRGA